MEQNHEYLRRLFRDSRIVELRHSYGDQRESGIFNNIVNLERAVRDLADVGNMYTSLNRPHSFRVTNCFRSDALRDEDIETITRIVFDLDPKRPTNLPSTDAELKSALTARDLVVRTLSAYGWPAPALAISGNGAHAVYRTCLVNSSAWRKQAAMLYAGLRSHLQGQMISLGVDFDTTVRNPARVWRLYGSVNRKGHVAHGRPHRRASIILPAGDWQIVKAATVERTVRTVTPVVEGKRRIVETSRFQVTGKGDYTTLDVVAWFTAHDAYRRPLSEGKHAVICPWSAEHSIESPEGGTDTVVWEATIAWPNFFCSHNHCAGRSVRDVFALWGDADEFCTRTWSREQL